MSDDDTDADDSAFFSQEPRSRHRERLGRYPLRASQSATPKRVRERRRHTTTMFVDPDSWTPAALGASKSHKCFSDSSIGFPSTRSCQCGQSLVLKTAPATSCNSVDGAVDSMSGRFAGAVYVWRQIGQQAELIGAVGP